MPKSRKYGLIAARLFIDLFRSSSEELFASADITSTLDLSILCAALYVGTEEGRPMTATKIAEYVRIPRPTVIRKLEQLRSMGKAVQDEDKRWLMALDSEDARALAIRHAALLRKASTELSRLDGVTIATEVRRNYTSRQR